MPHPEQEHALMIEVARLRAENERLEMAARAYIEGHELAMTRAEAAEEALAAANAELAVWRDEDAREAKYEHVSKRCTAAEEALAAARRECDLLRDTLTLIAGFPCSGNSYEPVRLARKALAAPAAASGEEGTR